MSPRSLTELVDAASTWSAVDWWRLEMRSFSRTPAQRALALLAPAEAMSEHRGTSLGSVIQSLAYLFSIVAPLIGAAAMLRWVFGDTAYDFPIVLAGVLTLLTLPVTGWSEVQRMRHPRAATASGIRIATLIHVIPGAFTLVISLTAGQPHLEGGAWAWLVVIAVDVAIHLAILARGPLPENGPQNLRDNLEWSLREFPPGLLSDVVARRDAAVRLLGERGLIDADTQARALAAAPGELALTLAPELEKAAPR